MVSQLEAMGFDRRASVEALNTADGDMQATSKGGGYGMPNPVQQMATCRQLQTLALTLTLMDGYPGPRVSRLP